MLSILRDGYPLLELKIAILDTLRGARGVPSAEAIAKLSEFPGANKHFCPGQPRALRIIWRFKGPSGPVRIERVGY